MIQLSRDLPIGLLLVYSFTLAVYIAGNGIQSQLHNASLLVHDNDHSFSSRELIHKFKAPFFRLEGEITDPQEGLRWLDQGKAIAVLEIPPRFHEQLKSGQPTAVQLLVDTTSAPRLVHLHLKDVLAPGGHETCRYGAGCVQIEQCVEMLKQVGYIGGISVEHEPEHYDPTEDCQASLALLQAWLDT